MAQLSSEQQKNLATILRVGKRMGASKKALKAAVEAGLVESNLRNLDYGDRDSVGVFQQRPSQGWKGLTNVGRAAEEFFAQAIPNAGKYGTAGQLAQAVQRSAYPDRYDQRSSEAAALLRGVRPPSSTATPVSSTDTRNTALALSLLGMGGSDYSLDPLQLALAAAAQKGSTSRVSPSPRASGAQTNPGLYKLAKIAQNKFGLSVREFEPFDKVDPVHTSGSYHYKNKAMDVSGDPARMKAFNEYVARRHGKWVAEMFYDKGVNLDNGKRTGAIGGHSGHVHVAVK